MKDKNKRQNFWKRLNFRQQQFIKRALVFLVLYTIYGYAHQLISHYLYAKEEQYIEKYFTFFIFPIFTILTAFYWSKINQVFDAYYAPSKGKLFFLLSILVHFIPVQKALDFGWPNQIVNVLLFGVYFFSFLFLFIALFGLDFFNKVIREVVIIIVAYCLYLLVQISLIYYWQYFSFIIIATLSWVLPLFISQVRIEFDTFNVTYNSFAVNIGPVCSGFYSILTFTLLFLVTLVLFNKDRRILYARSVLAYIAGVYAVFALNIVRLIIIIIIGGAWSPKLALDFFHEYLMAIFSILLFLLYLYKIVPLITKNRLSCDNIPSKK